MVMVTVRIAVYMANSPEDAVETVKSFIHESSDMDVLEVEKVEIVR